eukprot:jgi/Galph1/3875/GphlegSOOS_G2524.1
MSVETIEEQTKQLFTLFAQEITPFVCQSLQQVLGENEWLLFVSLPPPWSVEEVLKIIRDRWFAVFSDSILDKVSLVDIGKGKQVINWLYTLRMDYLNGKNLSEQLLVTLARVIGCLLEAIQSPLLNHVQKIVERQELSSVESMNLFTVDKIAENNSNGWIAEQREEEMEIDETALTSMEDMWSSWETKPLIVLDGANIAWKHGKHQKFSALGIVLAWEFFIHRNYECVCFLSETCKLKDNESYGILHEMKEKNDLVFTPAEDYDDAYIIYYAQKHGGLIVSNDRFLDHLEQIREDTSRRRMAQWLTYCRLTFTFRENEFLPNPSFHMAAAIRCMHDWKEPS